MIDVVQKGYKLGDRVVRPARVVIAAPPAGRERWLRRSTTRSASRRAPRRTRSRRRTASSRASTTRTRTRATRPRRSASRRCRRRTTSSPTTRSGRRTTASARRTGAARPVPAAAQRRLRRLRLRRSRRHLRRHLRRRPRAAARGARAPQPVRGADVETEVRLSFEDSLRGAEAKVPVELTVACSRVRRHGRGARHGAGHLPGVQRPRRQLRVAGPLRALAAVPALPRQRHRDRAAVLEVPRLGPRAAAARRSP